MNPKIFVGAAVGALAVIIGIIGFSGSSIINDISEGDSLLKPSENTQSEILPLDITLEDIEILEVSEKAAYIETSFKVSNPNSKSIILHMIKYELYENDVKISINEIGQRPEGMVVGSNYYIILNEQPTILKDKIIIKNTGNTPELWSALQEGSANWKIKGVAFFNLSSMTSGGENEITFELTK